MQAGASPIINIQQPQDQHPPAGGKHANELVVGKITIPLLQTSLYHKISDSKEAQRKANEDEYAKIAQLPVVNKLTPADEDALQGVEQYPYS